MPDWMLTMKKAPRNRQRNRADKVWCFEVAACTHSFCKVVGCMHVLLAPESYVCVLLELLGDSGVLPASGCMSGTDVFLG